jgi:hypothetical protein
MAFHVGASPKCNLLRPGCMIAKSSPGGIRSQSFCHLISIKFDNDRSGAVKYELRENKNLLTGTIGRSGDFARY